MGVKSVKEEIRLTATATTRESVVAGDHTRIASRRGICQKTKKKKGKKKQNHDIQEGCMRSMWCRGFCLGSPIERAKITVVFNSPTLEQKKKKEKVLSRCAVLHNITLQSHTYTSRERRPRCLQCHERICSATEFKKRIGEKQNYSENKKKILSIPELLCA